MNRVEMMDALNGINQALRAKQITLSRLPWNEKVMLHQDVPDGRTPRMSYARQKGSSVTALAVIVPADPIDGVPCFHLGYAVAEDQRGKGLATDLAGAAVEDMRRNLIRMGATRVACEAMVECENEASLAVARKVFGNEGEEKIDEATGKPSMQFFRYFEAS